MEMANGASMDGEGINGVRMTWNYWPKTKVELRKCVIPLAASISPIHYHPQIPTLPYAPLRCKTCQALLNPYATVDFTSHIWVCPFCYQRNHFPPHYTGISETTLPGELYPQHTTAQYALPSTRASHAPHVYLFVIDTCLIEEELGFVKSAVLREINFLPRNGVVGLITYGAQVHVHELGFTDMNKVFIFRGSKNVSKDRVLEQLGLGRCGVRNGGSNLGLNRFLLPANDCEYALNVLLDELPTAQRPVQPGSRASRCTGVALSIAAGLLGAYSPGTSARIIALVGGPCTEGPGRIVSKDLSKPVRSHKDLDNGTAPYFQKAVKFYDNLAKQLVSQGHVLDLFASALDQVGVAEMKVAVEKTGGLVVLAESFGHSVFKDSFKRLFQSGEQSLGSCFNGMLEVYCSKDIKIQGIIGPCTSLEKKGVAVADTVIGQGNTTAWKLCSLDKTTYLTVFFDVSSNDRSSPLGTPELYLQFLTSYQDPEGKDMLRVTTVCRRWVENSLGSEELVQGFDQETAAVVMTRLCSQKMESEEGFDATRWLDRNLIRLCSKFGDFRKDDPASFNLNSSFSLFPQLMFNLRRSQFVQVFNNSPDETASFRMLLNRESITNAAVMIQPSLISYSFNYPPSPALLDVSSIVADRILLLDSYFSVVIFHGMTIAQWRNMGYQDQAEHQAFAQLLRAPRDDAQIIIQDRFPVPRLVVCDQHGSQARFLLAKLNPSATYNKVNDMAAGSDVIFTDDVSLQVFYEHLQRLVVQS